MRVICSHCNQLVEVRNAAVGPDRVAVRCPSCKQYEQLELVQPADIGLPAVRVVTGSVPGPQPAALPASAPAASPAPAPAAAVSRDPELEEPPTNGRPPVLPRSQALWREMSDLADDPALRMDPDGKVQCPKCGFRQTPPTHCTRCGLAARNWRDYAAKIARDRQLNPGLATLEDLWTQVKNHFADENAHRKFVAAAETFGALEDAGRKYRAILDDNPGDAMAKRQIERILQRGSAALMAVNPRTGAVEPGRGKITRVYVIAAVVMAAVLWILLQMVRQTAPPGFDPNAPLPFPMPGSAPPPGGP